MRICNALTTISASFITHAINIVGCVVQEIFSKCTSYLWQKPEVQASSALKKQALVILKLPAKSLAEVEKIEHALTALIPAVFYPLNIDLQSEEEAIFQKNGLAGITCAFTEKQNALCIELEATILPSNDQKVTQLQSQLLRLSDIFYKVTCPFQPIACDPFLQLKVTSYVCQSSHQKSSMEEIPAYLHYFAHACDSEKQIGEISAFDAVGEEKKLYANLFSSYVKTLLYSSQNMLTNRLFEKLDPASLKTLFFDLAKKLLDIHRWEPSDKLYRQTECVVYDSQMNPQRFHSLATFYEARNDIQKGALFREIHSLVLRWGYNFDRAQKFLKKRHWEVLQVHGVHICPPVDQVPLLLDSFFQKLEQHLKNEKLHPFQVASFMLYTLCKIHPFDKNNGVFSRLFMNLYLMQKGFLPVIIFKEAEWLALFEEADFETACCAYLDKAIQEAKQSLKKGSLPTTLNLLVWEGNDMKLLSHLDLIDS